MNDPRPGDRLAHTILAHPPISEEESYGTEQTVVVQGLDHWNPFGSSDIVTGRGD
jgi:hypothetical protein